MRLKGKFAVLALMVFSMGSRAHAYPSSVIFAPTGESLGLGEFGVYAYVPLNLRPRVGPAAAWLGVDVGVIPTFSWAEELEFGGLELGVDLIQGASHPDGSVYTKTIFNAKLGVLADTGYVPAVGFGIMSFAPFQARESVNLTYLSATKSLRVFDHDVGSLTLGAGYAIAASTFAFRGSPPLRDSRLAPLLGYTTPAWQGLTLSFDSVGGLSEASSTNVAASYSVNEQTSLMVGAYFANDRALPDEEISDGVFANIGANFEPFARAEQSK